MMKEKEEHEEQQQEGKRMTEQTRDVHGRKEHMQDTRLHQDHGSRQG